MSENREHQGQVLSQWTNVGTLDLEVTSPSNRLYRNGRQQVEITVRIRVFDADGAVVPLDDTQRRSVRLIDYQSGDALPAVPASGVVAAGWGATRERNQFGFFPGTREAAASTPHSPGYEYFTWYVQTAADAPLRIGCEVRRDAQTLFQSNADNFKSFVEAMPERLPSRTAAAAGSAGAAAPAAVEYPLERQRVEGDADEWDLTTVDYYYCGVRINGNNVKLLEFTVVPASMFQWESTNPTSESFSFTGYGVPGGTTATYRVPSLFDSRRHLTISRPRSGSGVLVLIRQVGIQRSSAGDAHMGDCEITAIDEFGNPHLLRASFKSASERNELVVTPR